MRKKIFVIEHLEPKVWKWCGIEYEHISQIVGKRNLWFTNITRKNKRLEKVGKVFGKSVRELKIDRKKICILDPDAKKELTPKDSKKFDYFVFGGILGDHPPKKRTKKELTPFLSGAAVRHLGKRQMATDNAVYVVKEITEGKRLKDISFANKAVIKINDIESIILPFQYAKVDGKPLMDERLVTYLRRKKGF